MGQRNIAPNVPPVVSDEGILARVGVRSFARGRAYFLGGALFDTRKTATGLRARCEGSGEVPYHVRAKWEHHEGPFLECSCPVGAEGSCKHAAALLLAWSHAPEEFAPGVDVDAALARSSAPELIALLRSLRRKHPEVEVSIEEFLTPAGAHSIAAGNSSRRSVAEVFRRRGQAPGSSAAIAHDLHALLVHGDERVRDGSFRSGAEVYRAVADAVALRYLRYEEHDEGHLRECFDAAVARMCACLCAAREEAPLREFLAGSLLGLYALDVEQDGRGLGGRVSVALRERAGVHERRAMGQRLATRAEHAEGWARRLWDAHRVALGIDGTDPSVYLDLCRALRRPRDLLHALWALGRMEEAAQQAREVPVSALVSLVRELDGEEVLEWCEERCRTEASPELFAALRDRYIAMGNTSSALSSALRLFSLRPELEGYHSLQVLAESLGTWSSVRATALDAVRDRSQPLLAEVYLAEGRVSEAYEVLRAESLRGTYAMRVRQRVAEACVQPRPALAAELWCLVVEELLRARNRMQYREGAQLAARAREAWMRAGQPESWLQWAAQLRAKHEALPALREEFEAVGVWPENETGNEPEATA